MTDQPPVEPMRVDTGRIVLLGVGCWLVALVVVLLVPSLHRDGRGWWPWVPAVGAGLGVLGYAYVRRGRGNAAAAR